VADVSLDQALPVVRNLAGRKANFFALPFPAFIINIPPDFSWGPPSPPRRLPPRVNGERGEAERVSQNSVVPQAIAVGDASSPRSSRC
jgi:hypothetical protein